MLLDSDLSWPQQRRAWLPNAHSARSKAVCGEAQCQGEGDIPSAPGYPTSDIMRSRVSSDEGENWNRFTQPLMVHCKSQAHHASTLQTSAVRERDVGQLKKCSVANQEAKTFTNDVLVGLFFCLFFFYFNFFLVFLYSGISLFLFWGRDLKHYRANVSLMEKKTKQKKYCIP